MAQRSEDLGKLVLRLTVGGLLLFHGVAKLQHGVAWMAGPLAKFGLPASVAYGSYVGEVVGPLLLILGWRTRIGALLVAADLATAILLVQSSKIFAINEAGAWGIEIEAFFLLTALAVALLGGGRLSLSKGSGRWD
jgi:putative oxidoreductase